MTDRLIEICRSGRVRLASFIYGQDIAELEVNAMIVEVHLTTYIDELLEFIAEQRKALETMHALGSLASRRSAAIWN